MRFKHLRSNTPILRALIGALKGLGIEAEVKQGSNVRLTATLQTPKGKVELS